MENKELEKKYNKIIYKYPYLNQRIICNDDESVIDDESLDGKKIYAVEKNGHLYYLNSRYSCKKETEIIIKKMNANGNPYAPIMMFGIGNGFLLKEIRKNFKENYIYIHEPSVSIFRKFLSNINEKEIDFLFGNHTVLTVGDDMEGAIVEVVHDFINEKNFYIMDMICNPQYQNIFLEKYMPFLRTIHTRTEEVLMQKNTYIALNEEHIETFWKNLTDIYSQYGVASLTNILRDAGSKNYPAFIVSAGPSLDKNIEDLKKINGRGIILAVDTAINPLLKKGIMPDIIASVDPHKPMELFADRRFEKLPMIVDINSNSNVLKIHKGKRFYAWSGERFIKDLLKDVYSKLGVIESGGSVACHLFSLALMSGFKTIILVGQDLAYPNRQGHSAASYDNEKGIDINKSKYFEVEDIYGGKVYTERNMNAYRKWFEATIARYNELRYIDATEGGAKINGTEILKLQDVISECCKGVTAKNWHEVIDNCEPLATDEQKIKIICRIKQIPDQLEKIEEQLDKLDENIKKAQRAMKNNEERELKYYFDDIIRIIGELDKKLEIKLLDMYNAEARYFISMAVYNIDKENDTKNLIHMCELTSKQYRDAICVAKKDVEKKCMEL